MVTGYNGWTNYNTWNVNLWVTNDEPPYRFMVANRPYTAEKAELIAKELFPKGTPDMDGGSADYNDVNWQEIADAWNKD